MKRGGAPRDDETRQRVAGVFGPGRQVASAPKRRLLGPRVVFTILVFLGMFGGVALALFFGETRTAAAVGLAPIALLLLFGSAGENASWRRSHEERRARQRRTRASRTERR